MPPPGSSRNRRVSTKPLAMPKACLGRSLRPAREVEGSAEAKPINSALLCAAKSTAHKNCSDFHGCPPLWDSHRRHMVREPRYSQALPGEMRGLVAAVLPLSRSPDGCAPRGVIASAFSSRHADAAHPGRGCGAAIDGEQKGPLPHSLPSDGLTPAQFGLHQVTFSAR